MSHVHHCANNCWQSSRYCHTLISYPRRDLTIIYLPIARWNRLIVIDKLSISLCNIRFFGEVLVFHFFILGVILMVWHFCPTRCKSFVARFASLKVTRTSYSTHHLVVVCYRYYLRGPCLILLPPPRCFEILLALNILHWLSRILWPPKSAPFKPQPPFHPP